MSVNNKAEQNFLNYLNLAILKFYISEFAMCVFSNYFLAENYPVGFLKEKSKN